MAVIYGGTDFYMRSMAAKLLWSPKLPRCHCHGRSKDCETSRLRPPKCRKSKKLLRNLVHFCGFKV